MPAANSVYKPLLVAGCVSQFACLPCGNSTTKRSGHATAHTRGRYGQLKKATLQESKDFVIIDI
jgi:hypothetical protein